MEGRGVGAHSVKYGNKSLDDKNILNEVILIKFFLKVKGDFPLLDVQKIYKINKILSPLDASDI